MYAIHFRRCFDSREDFAVIAENIPSLTRAKELREVSGDLVVHQDTDKVVQGDGWLFDWELNNSDCYARKVQRADSK